MSEDILLWGLMQPAPCGHKRHCSFNQLPDVSASVSSSVSSALSQIMLFVDGMNGVIRHAETLQWLYALTGSLVRIL